MSLLMQALKKAERAKLSSSQESELDKPSEAFDELLALTPQEPAAAPAAPAFSLDRLSLSPLDEAPSGNVRAAAPPPPAAAPEWTIDSLAAIPAPSVASEAIHNPVPPQARHQEPAADTGLAAAGPARAPAEPPAATAGPKTAPPADTAAPRPAAAAARARAAAAVAPRNELSGMDPAKLRITVLSGIVVLIVLGYGYYFWQATNGPGSGGRLPMVPMPPPNATGATPALVVVPGAAGPASPAAPDNGAGADVAPLAPQEKQRRERQQERDQMYAEIVQQLQSQMQQRPAPAPETLPVIAAPENTDIRIARSSSTAQIPSALSQAYTAFGNGDLKAAQQQYDTMLQQDPNNRDALLGSAMVAIRQRLDERAAAAYGRLLELDPNDADALAGLSGLRQGDLNQSELRLNNALKRNPDSAPLLFALGNLYARQGRWPEAQQTYFRAFTAAPGNPDYAFNLAIGLDRLNQPKLALTYYQRALALAQDQVVSFDRAALRKRVHDLGAPAQP